MLIRVKPLWRLMFLKTILKKWLSIWVDFECKYLLYSAPPICGVKYYSALKLFTGFANAALNAWKLTVINAIRTAITPASAKIHQLIFMR